MTSTIVIGGKIISGEDMDKLLEEADRELIKSKMTYVDRAYGHGGWQ